MLTYGIATNVAREVCSARARKRFMLTSASHALSYFLQLCAVRGANGCLHNKGVSPRHVATLLMSTARSAERMAYQRKMVAVVAGFTALSFQFSTSVCKKHQSIKLARKPAIIGYHMLVALSFNT